MVLLIAVLGVVLGLWVGVIAALWVWKGDLLRATWNEPYLGSPALLIESDDWGPGADYHAERLGGLSATLRGHRDVTGRPAVLTADIVLAVADTTAMREDGWTAYHRRPLDQGFDSLLDTIREAMEAGTLVPQLHGLEHYYGAGLARLMRENDARVADLCETPGWSDWEALDPPLQGHYVDGTRLPTRVLAEQEQRDIVATATATFRRVFGFPSRSTVAPCYLWQDVTEGLWAEQGVVYIQTAGYRCRARDGEGHYQQDLREIRFGDRSSAGQIYLVRNAMYEPVDGNGVEICLEGARRALREGLPVVISTHRYNYTRSEEEYRTSMFGLDTVLRTLAAETSGMRYLSSSEIGDWARDPAAPIIDSVAGNRRPPLAVAQGRARLSAYLFRLWGRHRKLRLLALGTGLVLPLSLLASWKRAFKTAG